MLILLVLSLAICLAVWAAMLAWRGNWKAAAIALGSPLLLAIAIAALAMSGALDSGHSEDWGPLMALLLAGAMAMFSIICLNGKRSGVEPITSSIKPNQNASSALRMFSSFWSS